MSMAETRTDPSLAEKWWAFPSFVVEHVVTGLYMPVNVAFVPRPNDDPNAALIVIPLIDGRDSECSLPPELASTSNQSSLRRTSL